MRPSKKKLIVRVGAFGIVIMIRGFAIDAGIACFLCINFSVPF